VIRSGALHHLFPATFPSGQGSDLAGVVAELGRAVSGFAVGDELIGFSMRRSSHGEYVAVPANQFDTAAGQKNLICPTMFLAVLHSGEFDLP
jgi:NADPH:quinone reductase-like Zn-dependent oxidoreductase